MKLWLDAQLSPRLVAWMSTHFAVEVYAVRELGLRDAKDQEIFLAAKQAEAVIVTKDFFLVPTLWRGNAYSKESPHARY